MKNMLYDIIEIILFLSLFYLVSKILAYFNWYPNSILLFAGLLVLWVLAKLKWFKRP